MRRKRRAAATRSNMVRLRKRLSQVERGAELLRRKRESLVAELFSRARPVADSRRTIDARAQSAYRELLTALGSLGPGQLSIMGQPRPEIRLHMEEVELWGSSAHALDAPPPLLRGVPARGVFPATADSSAIAAAEAFERLVEELLEAAPRELLMRRLGQALSRTTRLENTLEQRVSVDLRDDISDMRRTLDEREREEQLRLKRVIARKRRR